MCFNELNVQEGESRAFLKLAARFQYMSLGHDVQQESPVVVKNCFKSEVLGAAPKINMGPPRALKRLKVSADS